MRGWLRVRDAKGGILGGRGYKGRIRLPFRVDAWDAVEVVFDLDPDDEVRAMTIQADDIDGRSIVVPQVRGRAGWHKTVSKRGVPLRA